jgi:glycerate-2-kinase
MDQKEKERLSEFELLYGSKIPDQLPIAFINQYRRQIEKNHDQTVEALIEGGGLHPRELIAAIYGMNLQKYFGKTKDHLSDEQTVFSLNMIRIKLSTFKKEEER